VSTVESEAAVQATSPLAALLEQAREIIARYPEGKQRSALLPLLHLVQSEDGFVTPDGVAFCADLLGLSRAQVAAVATFYTMYKRRPTGDFLVSVCTNTMCDVLGGREVYDTLTEHLGVGHDETTGDGTITLEHAECLAACDYGPVMTVNYEFFDGVEPGRAVDIVERLRAGERPMPSRGARLCTLKEMAVQLAGYADERPDALADAVAGEPTVRGNRLAERHSIAVSGFDPAAPIPTHAQREAAKVARPHPKFTDPAAGKAPGGTAATPSKDTQAADGGKEAGS
jgi:NADH-quinone oxidoreductase subunit E